MSQSSSATVSASTSKNCSQDRGDWNVNGSCQSRLDLVLPEEIWEMILGHLNNSKDLLHASYASPIFNGILQQKKRVWMFEEVLPHIFKDLRKSDLMTLRLVCKSWSRAVDNYVADHPSLHPFNEQIFRTVQSSFNYLPLSTKVYDDIAFVNGEQFVDFMESMKGHSRNPFFGRSIRIGSCGDIFDHIDAVIDDTWKGAIQLCQQFGPHLWHVEFANYEFSLSTLQFYKGVRQCLAHLPNLKALHMNGALDTCDEDDSQLLASMEANPMPELPHLESIVFDLVMETEPNEEEILERRRRAGHLPQHPDALMDYLQLHPEAIQQLLNEVPPTPDSFQAKFLSTYGTQLKKLEIDLPSWREEYGTLLENLTEIHLKHVSSIPTLKSVLYHLKTGRKLGKLVISLRCSMTTTELFELLEPLRILSLDFGYLGEAPDNYLIETTSTDDLPSISSMMLLRIKDTVSMTYEFLKKLPSIQHLDVWECQNARKQFVQQRNDADNDTQHEGDPEHVGSRITDELRKLIYGEDDESDDVMDNRWKSNIWKLLPSLKIITFRTRSGLPSVIKRFARDSYSWEYVCSY